MLFRYSWLVFVCEEGTHVLKSKRRLRVSLVGIASKDVVGFLDTSLPIRNKRFAYKRKEEILTTVFYANLFFFQKPTMYPFFARSMLSLAEHRTHVSLQKPTKVVHWFLHNSGFTTLNFRLLLVSLIEDFCVSCWFLYAFCVPYLLGPLTATN